ncbi:hypothetical protein QCA50_018021 [Cerrena zonata]|uniref:Uncharacterized protein n=1 Tax=Cerrena zonata TaxID=2478898 RepID=A0AAW0FDW5_9APHY
MHDPQAPSADLPSDEHLDALTYFFRRRKHLNDLRANDHSLQGTIRGLSLSHGSKVYKWEPLEFSPWFERTEVPECKRLEVWSSHTPAQRVYDEFKDAWDCAQDFAPLQDVNCNRSECREPFHDNLEEGGPTIESVGPRLPAHLQDPTTYHQPLAAEGGECLALSLTRYQMDEFLDVLKYRYGIKIPDRISPPDPRVQCSTLSQGLLEALRGMVQEEMARELQWKDPRLMTILEEFFSCIKTHKSVPLYISDCHLPDEAFERLNNPWRITNATQSSLGSGVSKWILKTLNSHMEGWYIRVNGRTTGRESKHLMYHGGPKITHGKSVGSTAGTGLYSARGGFVGF